MTALSRPICFPESSPIAFEQLDGKIRHNSELLKAGYEYLKLSRHNIEKRVPLWVVIKNEAASSRYQEITAGLGEEIMGNHSCRMRGMAGQQSRTQHWNWSCPSSALLKLLYLQRIIINEACYILNTLCCKWIMLDWFRMRALLQLSGITKTQSAGCEKRLPSPQSCWGRMKVGHSTPSHEVPQSWQHPGTRAPLWLHQPCVQEGPELGASPPEEMAWEGTGGNGLFAISVYKHLPEGHRLSQTHLISLPGQHSASSDLMQRHFAIQQCRILEKKGVGGTIYCSVHR